MSDLNGLINVYKPAGVTSHDVVNKIRRLLKVKKVGHTGTLDPAVTGVLPICVGKATKIAQYLTDKKKGYRGELTLGISTDTQDKSGEVIQELDASLVKEKDIREVFDSFKGKIEQIPPMVSAVRHKGKKLYELAREGKIVERAPRQVEIFSLDIIEIKDLGTKHPKVTFEVLCSKGTYIRTLCTDIGEKLGVGGHMSFLIRTFSGPFTLEQALTLEFIEENFLRGNINAFLQPVDTGLLEWPFIKVNPSLEAIVKNGNRIFLPGVVEKTPNLSKDDLVRIYCNSKLIAIGKAEEDKTYQGTEQRIYFQPINVLL